jgi:hypothetical protein
MRGLLCAALLALVGCGSLANQLEGKNYRDPCTIKSAGTSDCQSNLICAVPTTCGNPPINGCQGTCSKSCAQDADCGPCRCTAKTSTGALVCDVLHCSSATDGGSADGG